MPGPVSTGGGGGPLVFAASPSSGAKVAVTLVLPFIVTVHVLAKSPHPPPFQPKKPQLVAGLAVNVTCAPGLKFALHVEPQLIPDGELVTAPPGLPISETDNGDDTDRVTSVRLHGGSETLKLAPTVPSEDETGPAQIPFLDLSYSAFP